MGKVVDTQVAFTVCSCYKLDPEKPITADNLQCYSRGIKGILKQCQLQDCKRLVIKPASPALTKNVERIRETGALIKACIHTQGKIEDYDECLKKEIEKKTVTT